jgi:hypothetical protein
LDLHVLGAEVSLVEENTFSLCLIKCSQRILVFFNILEQLLVRVVRRLHMVDWNYEQIVSVYGTFGVRQIALII